MIKNYDNELELELKLINSLGEGHNQWTYRSDLKSESDLWDNLREKITRNNLDALNDVMLTDYEFELVKTELLSKTTTPFYAAKWLKGENGIARITIDREDVRLGSLSLILYSNRDIGGGISSYEIVNQIATKPSDTDNRNRRFDTTLLINGLPIVQIELKQVRAKDGFYQAFRQIKKYAEEGLFRNNIFSTLQLFVISNEQTTRYFANAMPEQMNEKYLFSWRTKDNERIEDIYEFSKQVLNIPDAHRLIADYTIVSEDQDNKTLMVLHPYQIHAIESLYRAAMQHQSGYIWHATGSGKTLTSFVSTKLLARKTGVDRTIMLVDRKDLDNQTTGEFTKFASEFNTGISSGTASSNSLIVGTGSSRELSEALLSETNTNTIIVTTRQKLDAAMRYAEKQESERGTHRFKKLVGSHIVFVVDECHRAVSSEGMEEVKKLFPNSTWFGFTGTPIFEVNKKQAQGRLARTTDDQYGPCLHTYTIKNALDDRAVLGFQVEHEDTVGKMELDNAIFRYMRKSDQYASVSDNELNEMINKMNALEKEKHLSNSDYESQEHIDTVVYKILKPDNAAIKFKFKNGKPTMSAILTTSSIDMAKRYYNTIKSFTEVDDWYDVNYKNSKMREGYTIDDPDFPRIAITYSIQENDEQAHTIQNEMKEIIEDYNQAYDTSWRIEDIDRYNGDINNRLARKKGEYRIPGNQVDLVIVVDRLLTGFDAPTIQTLFVDRNLVYANLIQAFSRTNRTYPGKDKGLIVTFRKPETMKKNVEDATLLYSNENNRDSGLIYPSYEESKRKFDKASLKFKKLIEGPIIFSEDAPIENNIEFVKVFQELAKSYEALITYDDFNEVITTSKSLKEKVNLLRENEGLYNSIKAAVMIEQKDDKDSIDLKDVEFYTDISSTIYDIDSAYITKLLGLYVPYNSTIREDIEKALDKLNKAEFIKDIYRSILNDIDSGKIKVSDDTHAVKRHYFSEARAYYISEFAKEWSVSESELMISAVQYRIGMDKIPNIGRITGSMNVSEYGNNHNIDKVIPFIYHSKIKESWLSLLDSTILEIDGELN